MERCRVRTKRRVGQRGAECETETAREAARAEGMPRLPEEVSSDTQREGVWGEEIQSNLESQTGGGARGGRHSGANRFKARFHFSQQQRRTESTRLGLASSSAFSRSVLPLCAASTTSFAFFRCTQRHAASEVIWVRTSSLPTSELTRKNEEGSDGSSRH